MRMFLIDHVDPERSITEYTPGDKDSIYRGPYMSVHVLLNLFNELGKRDKIRALYLFCATSLINSIIQAHEC